MNSLRLFTAFFRLKFLFLLAGFTLTALLLAACGYSTPENGGALTPFVEIITPTPLPRTDAPIQVSPSVAPTETPVVTVAIDATIPPNTPAPTPKYTPTLAVNGDNYTVQSGDTLYGISKRLGVDYQAMIDLNKLDDPNNLQVGQVLKIPPRTSTVLGPTATSTVKS